MQTGHLKTAQSLLAGIRRQFPSSNRADRLYGMLLESMGDTDGANGVYKSQLKKDPQDAAAIRRTAAAKAGQGDLIGALEILKDHLKVHLADWMSWEEGWLGRFKNNTGRSPCPNLRMI